MQGRLRSLLGRPRSVETVMLAATGVGIATSIIIARALGPSGRGDLTFITVWVQVLGFVAAFMLGHACAVISLRPDSVGTPATVFYEATWLLLRTTPLPAAAAFALGLAVLGSPSIGVSMALGVVATAGMEIVQGYLLAVKRRPTYLSIRLAQPMIYFAGATLAMILLRGSSLETQVTAIALCLTVSILALPAVIYFLARPPRPARSKQVRRALVRFAIGAQVAASLTYLNLRLDLMAIPFAYSSAEVGIYAIGVAPAQLLVMIGGAGSLRAFTGEEAARDKRGILVVLGLSGLWILASPWLIPAVFGHSFEASVPVAQISALGAVPGFALQHTSGRFLWEKRTWALGISQGAGAAVFLGGFLLAQTISGVAWASVASYVVALAVAEVLLSRGSAAGPSNARTSNETTPS